jgi:hypothetical protein
VIKHLAVVALGSWVFAGCLSGDEVESAGSAIVGGQVEPGYEAVGELLTAVGGCTATLVAPDVVLSAKHCLAGDVAPGEVSFRTGQNGETLAGVGSALFYLGGFDLSADGTLAQDFVAVRLDRAVENIDPMPLRRSPLGAEDAGRGVLHVGYGFTSEQGGDYGTRRSGAGIPTSRSAWIAISRASSSSLSWWRMTASSIWSPTV